MAERLRQVVTGSTGPEETRVTPRQKFLAWFIAILMLFSIAASLGTLLVQQ